MIITFIIMMTMKVHSCIRLLASLPTAAKVIRKALDTGLLGRDAVALGEWFPTFRRVVVPSKRREPLTRRHTAAWQYTDCSEIPL